MDSFLSDIGFGRTSSAEKSITAVGSQQGGSAKNILDQSPLHEKLSSDANSKYGKSTVCIIYVLLFCDCNYIKTGGNCDIYVHNTRLN